MLLAFALPLPHFCSVLHFILTVSDIYTLSLGSILHFSPKAPPLCSAIHLIFLLDFMALLLSTGWLSTERKGRAGNQRTLLDIVIY